IVFALFRRGRRRPVAARRPYADALRLCAPPPSHGTRTRRGCRRAPLRTPGNSCGNERRPNCLRKRSATTATRAPRPPSHGTRTLQLSRAPLAWTYSGNGPQEMLRSSAGTRASVRAVTPWHPRHFVNGAATAAAYVLPARPPSIRRYAYGAGCGGKAKTHRTPPHPHCVSFVKAAARLRSGCAFASPLTSEKTHNGGGGMSEKKGNFERTCNGQVEYPAKSSP